MTFKTSKQLLEKVLDALTLVSGSSVQVYTEPMIYNYIQIMFDHLVEKRFWPHLTHNSTHTLDGVAGVVTDTITDIDVHTDIEWIRHDTIYQHKKIPFIKNGVFSDNGDLAYTAIAYGQPYYSDKLIQFSPKTSTDTVTIRARRKVAEFTADDVVPFDYLTILHAVTAHALSIDGMNPAAQQKHEILFSDRYEQLIINETKDTIESDRPSAINGDFSVITL